MYYMKNDFKIIWLNGMPRSGTSWLGQIFDSHPNTRYRLSPLFSYTFKNYVGENSKKEKWEEFFEKVYNITGDQFLEQLERKKIGQYPVFNKKSIKSKFLVLKHTRYHNLTESLLHNNPDVKVIHIVRNPCAAINSWINAPREFPETADPFKEWRNGNCRKTSQEEFWGFEDWVQLTKFYSNLSNTYPVNVFIVRYENLVNEPLKYVNKMFYFIGLKFHPQTEKFLIDCHNKHEDNDYAVFKNKSVKNKWKTQLDPRIRDEIISDLKGTELEVFLND